MAQPRQQVDPELAQLLQLAQFAHLVSVPQQELAAQERAKRLSAAVQLLGLQQETQHQTALEDIQRRGVASEEAYRTGMLEHGNMAERVNLIGELGRARATGAPVGDLLKYAGTIDPVLGEQQRQEHQASVDDAIKNYSDKFRTLAAKGNPDLLNAFRYSPAPGAPPIPAEAWDQLKATLPEGGVTATPAPSRGISQNMPAHLRQSSLTGNYDFSGLLSNLWGTPPVLKKQPVIVAQ